MSYEFWKGHGTENDFVLLPDLDGSIDLTPARVRALCDRRAGIGGDGVLRVIRTASLVEEGALRPLAPLVEEGALRPSAPLVEEGALRPSAPLVEEGALRPSRNQGTTQPEWFMDYRNCDGSVSEMCGNGIRVFARFLLDTGLVVEGPIEIGTRGGVKTVTVSGDELTADLGVARVLGETKVSAVGRTWPAVHVDLGNPHAVAFVDDLDEPGALLDPPAYDEGVYPDGVNVEFVVRRGPDHLAMRVHERGSGETRSCGTGACAALVAAVPSGPASVRVDVPGGTLRVSRDEAGHVHLAGPAVIVARGTTDL
ncbi:MAG: diaminopimelate epimerase [Nocardioides sp.]